MTFTDLGLTSTNAGGGCCGGGACMCGHGDAASLSEGGTGNVTTTIGVTGMTCGHCVSSVTEELSALGSVTGVTVNLVPGEESAVTIVSDEPLETAAVRAAIEDAGYAMA